MFRQPTYFIPPQKQHRELHFRKWVLTLRRVYYWTKDPTFRITKILHACHGRAWQIAEWTKKNNSDRIEGQYFRVMIARATLEWTESILVFFGQWKGTCLLCETFHWTMIIWLSDILPFVAWRCSHCLYEYGKLCTSGRNVCFCFRPMAWQCNK